MPLLDMPLAELEKYQGRNPRPDDFDEFWDQSLAEMHTVEPEIELIPSRFQAPGAECFDLWFTGVGGARIHAKYLQPLGKQNCPVLLHFHGYTMQAGDWADKLGYVGAGFAVAALDCRGQGGLSQDVSSLRGTTQHGHIIRGLDESRPEKLLFRNVFLDVAQIAGIVKGFSNVDPTKVYSVGGSQGGALALVCAALEPTVARAAPAYPFLSDYQRVWEMDLAQHAYGELRSFFRQVDPRHEREAEIFTRLGYIDIQHLMPRVKAEVLMGIGLADNITPPSTCFAAFNKITSKKRTVVYPDFGHEGLPGFNDIVFEFLTA